MLHRKLADEREDEIQVVGGEPGFIEPADAQAQGALAVEFIVAGAGVGERVQAVHEEVVEDGRRRGGAVSRRAEHFAHARRQPDRIDLQLFDQGADLRGSQFGDAAGGNELDSLQRRAEGFSQLLLRQAARLHDAADRRGDGMSDVFLVAHGGFVFQVKRMCLLS